MKNALTIDVEDYFQVTAFESVVNRRDWAMYPSRVRENTQRILNMLDEYSLTGTFFVLGWVAERHPSLVRAIADRGHEIACHGYAHKLIYKQNPDIFRQDVRRAKDILENCVGRPVLGYRAPSYSITTRSMWALDILIQECFAYDSSIFPIYHDNYGIPGAKRFPHVIERPDGRIHEFPMSTLRLRLLGREVALPVAGGGYLRFLPVCLVHRAMARINSHEKQPVVLYFHPWEVDPGQPRIRARLTSRFRHYVNLDVMEDKLRYLFRRLSFAPMSEVLGVSGPSRPGEADHATA
ncbi:MAG: DUF3473 domain-containing protein [Opitutae bacterium]|nr:DUF3473 domain-containing protein [Opitutae bacterium]